MRNFQKRTKLGGRKPRRLGLTPAVTPGVAVIREAKAWFPTHGFAGWLEVVVPGLARETTQAVHHRFLQSAGLLYHGLELLAYSLTAPYVEEVEAEKDVLEELSSTQDGLSRAVRGHRPRGSGTSWVVCDPF